jgi:hypothetical protein
MRSAVDEALATLAGRAQHEGAERPVFIRVGEHDGLIYLDLGDSRWRAVEVGPDGWRVVEDPPVRFIRPKGMEALPEPVPGGDLSELSKLLNLGGERNQRLVTGWLPGTLNPKGPYSILLLHGEQGSAKSTTARALRYSVDPHATPLRSDPHGPGDLVRAAQNNWIVAFDNVSSVPRPLSDALCRVATGVGFTARKLYTDEEELLVQVCRPILVNGIAAEMASRPDLLDRAVAVELPPIPDGRRRLEAEVWPELEAARPRLLGALLDAVSAGLRHREDVRPPELPRMADFARWAEACGRGLGWQPDSFVDTLKGLRSEQDGLTPGVWPVMPALTRLLGKHGPFEGTVSQLLDRLNAQRSGSSRQAAD